MLCMQQCIDLCELTPEEAQAVRDHASLAEILAIQAECPHVKAAVAGTAADAEAILGCGMMEIRDQLIEDIGADDDFTDLEPVVHPHCAYALARDEVVTDNSDGG